MTDNLAWTTARYNGGQCPKCKRLHKEGDRIFCYPNDKRVYCEQHGKEAAVDSRLQHEKERRFD